MSGDIRHMSRAGKTFYFASMWLDRDARAKAAVAYCFCRTVDDLADDNPPGPERMRALTGIMTAIKLRDVHHSDAGAMVRLAEEYPEILEPALSLVEACAADVPGLEIRTERDLISYSHGVAGNVGLIMYPLLGGSDPRGRALADDLGIAMQCTNIARDVMADLKAGRMYLPHEWLLAPDLRGLLLGDALTESSVVHAVGRVLEVGRQHYRRGLSGLHYLSPRARLAIRIAADCYSAIGERVVRKGRLVRRRAVVPLRRKIIVAFRAIQGRAPLAAQLSGAR